MYSKAKQTFQVHIKCRNWTSYLICDLNEKNMIFWTKSIVSEYIRNLMPKQKCSFEIITAWLIFLKLLIDFLKSILLNFNKMFRIFCLFLYLKSIFIDSKTASLFKISTFNLNKNIKLINFFIALKQFYICQAVV